MQVGTHKEAPSFFFPLGHYCFRLSLSLQLCLHLEVLIEPGSQSLRTVSTFSFPYRQNRSQWWWDTSEQDVTMKNIVALVSSFA